MTEWMNLVDSSLCLCIIVFLQTSNFTLVGYQVRREECEANSSQYEWWVYAIYAQFIFTTLKSMRMGRAGIRSRSSPLSRGAIGMHRSFLLASFNDLLYHRSDGFPCCPRVLMLIRPHPPLFLAFKLPNILYLQLALLDPLK